MNDKLKAIKQKQNTVPKLKKKMTEKQKFN